MRTYHNFTRNKLLNPRSNHNHSRLVFCYTPKTNPLSNIAQKLIHTFLNNPSHRQSNRQTDKQTNWACLTEVKCAPNSAAKHHEENITRNENMHWPMNTDRSKQSMTCRTCTHRNHTPWTQQLTENTGQQNSLVNHQQRDVHARCRVYVPS